MVGLLTLNSRIYNYGGFLQEMALQDMIESLGYDCEIVDYAVAQEMNTFSMKRGIKNFSFEKLKRKLHDKKTTSYINDIYDAIEERKRAFDEYRKKSIHLSNTINYDELHSNKLKYEQLVCGSDQIWNPDYNIPAFFLNFGKEDCCRIIYAASIGRDYLSSREKSVYKKLLEFPQYISVREESAQRIISELTKKEVVQVLDPTLLHDREYWERKADQSSLKDEDYCFCYFLNLNAEKVSAAKNFARKNNYRVLTIPFLHNEYEPFSADFEGTLLSNVSPADFLNLIRKAKVVLTDSFHATVFSLIFQKEFWCFGRSAGKYNMNTRLHTLLNYVDLKERLISENDLDEKKVGESLQINTSKLNDEKCYSIAFLKKALSSYPFSTGELR